MEASKGNIVNEIYPRVTTHAMLRWLERVEGMNLQKERRLAALNGCDSENDHNFLLYLSQEKVIDYYATEAKILTPRVVAQILAGAAKVNHHGVILAITSWDITTVYIPGEPSRKPFVRRKREARRNACKRERAEIA